jgi:hypothetical protein
MNLDRMPTAYVISGQVPRDAYINEPTASQYSFVFISVNSCAVFGLWDDERCALGSIGMENGFTFSKP